MGNFEVVHVKCDRSRLERINVYRIVVRFVDLRLAFARGR